MKRKKSGQFGPSVAKAILGVGDGRGFVIEHRVDLPPFRGKRMFLDRRLVVTAAHCLPRLPPCHAASFWSERTFKLLASFDDPESTISAECVFADPVADIAVLREPDSQELGVGHDAYTALTAPVRPLRLASDPRGGRAWSLGLDGKWFSWEASFYAADGGLWMSATSKNEPGMSGSPILADDGTAIGLVAIGTFSGAARAYTPDTSGPHPVLANASVWVFNNLLNLTQSNLHKSPHRLDLQMTSR